MMGRRLIVEFLTLIGGGPRTDGLLYSGGEREPPVMRLCWTFVSRASDKASQHKTLCLVEWCQPTQVRLTEGKDRVDLLPRRLRLEKRVHKSCLRED
jgi:hypothetical protein